MKLLSKIGQQKGQIMIGFYVGLIAIMGMAIIVLTYMNQVRKDSSKREYKELALEVARAGFEETLSYFRIQPDGVYLPQRIRPASQGWVTPWLSWPDDAFRPTASDTQFFIPVMTYSNASTGFTYAGVSVSAAIVKDFALHISRTVATGNELAKGGLWGRFVVKRQVARNWSPGGNTHSVNTDPDAVHDITAARDFSNSAALGTGNFWSITSRGFVYLGSGVQTPGVSDDITVTASTVANSLTSSPRETYNGRPLLLASAKVYGELFRVNFSAPDAAVFVSDGNKISGNPNGVINGTAGASAVARNGSSGATGVVLQGGSNYLPGTVGYNPMISTIFPGMDKAKLKAIASKQGDIAIFPNKTAVGFTEQVSRISFYYLHKNDLPGQTFTFTDSMPERFQGTGLVFVDGNLTIAAGCVASWAGVVFVNGNAIINGPGEIFGTLIATGTVQVLGGINKGYIEYNSAAKDTAQKFLQGFKVDKPSVVTSYN